MSGQDRTTQLEARVADLQQTILVMESFARAASHDLRTPINALSGLLQLFEKKFTADLPADAATYLDHMKRATDQMADLTANLSAHTESAATPMVLERVAMSSVVWAVLDQLQDALETCGAEVAVDGEDFELLAEPTMLCLLLSHLVSNSIAHRAPARPFRLTLRMSQDGHDARIEISDTGTGFDPDKTHAIFAPFQRLTGQIEGTGIDLATCVEICRRHGWEISAYSDGTSGATFTVDFPNVPTPE